jgi:dTDP-4-amino-4,6-dideoxygalactose transaminase
VIPFHRPSVGEDEITAVAEVMRSGWLTSGPKVEQFEAAFAEATGAKYAVAVNSATAALHLGLEAMGVGPGDQVVVPTYTFTACGAVVLHLGAEVILRDVGEDYLLPRRGDRFNIPVHFAGQMAQVPSGALEDCAHRMPSKLLGTAAAYSFYATKPLTTGEGGMLVTNDEQIAARARLMRQHGVIREHGTWDYRVTEAGFKDNMSDMAAAMGLVQLGRQEELRAKRASIAARYDAAFDGHVGLPPRQDNWHLYVIRVPNRDEMMAELTRREIGFSIHFKPLHLHPFYQSLGYREGQFPVAEKLYRESLSLPIWPDMSDAQVNSVIAGVIAKGSDWWDTFG